MTDDTIFDKIIRKEIPAHIVYEDEWVVAFKDINPQAPVHVLVIPRKKVTGFAEFAKSNPLDIGEFFKRISLVASKLNLNDNGYRIVINHGQDGNQTVPYVHAHILGGRRLSWPPG